MCRHNQQHVRFLVILLITATLTAVTVVTTMMNGGGIVAQSTPVVFRHAGLPEAVSRQKCVADWMLQDNRTGEPDDTYLQRCQQRRKNRLTTLYEKYPKIVFVKHFDLGGSHYAYTEAQSDGQAERNFRPGAALCLLEIADDGDTKLSTIIEDKNGVIRDPDVSYDGKTIVFAWKKSDLLDDYHLYEYDTTTETVRQLTFGLGFADYEPCYLPDGDIIFNSTRCVQIVDCWWTEVSNLYRCDKDGQNIMRLSFDQVHTNYPTQMEDGRIIYTRWDYNDRGQIYPQALFQMNPDGTAQTELYGNNSWFPTTLLHSRGIPGSKGKVVSIFSGHHNWQYGKLGIVDPNLGRQENSGTQLIAPIRKTTADRIDAWGQDGDRFAYPYPVSETEFLVSYLPDKNAPRHVTTPFGLYWMNADGQRELLAFDPSISCHQPVPLTPRTAGNQRPSQLETASVDPNTKQYGTYTVQDVYEGDGMMDVPRGAVKKLRVVALDFRTVGIGLNHNSGTAGGALISTPIAIGGGAWDVKMVLGETPVYEDGSANFTVPAKTPVYFQLLDTNNHAIQTMRSWSTLQTGEVFSCFGCHENKNTSPPASAQMTTAMRIGPQSLIPFYGEPRGFSFSQEIQPILNRHCTECHPSKDAATAEETISLAATLVLDVSAKRYWSTSYLNLTGANPNDRKSRMNRNGRTISGTLFSARGGELVSWFNIQDPPSLQAPYRAGATQSRLLRMFDPNLAEAMEAEDRTTAVTTHHDVRLSREELDKLACWMDLLVPFCGSYDEHNAWDDAEKQKFSYYQAKQRLMAEPFATWKQAMAANPYRDLTQDETCTVITHKGGISLNNSVITRNPDHNTDGDHIRLWWEAEFSAPIRTDQLIFHRVGPPRPYPIWGQVVFEGGETIPFDIPAGATSQVLRVSPRKCSKISVAGDILPPDTYITVGVMGIL